MKNLLVVFIFIIIFACNKENHVSKDSLISITSQSSDRASQQYGNYDNYFFTDNIGKVGFELDKSGYNVQEKGEFVAFILENSQSNRQATEISIGATNFDYVETNDDGWVARGFCIENTVDNINRSECKGSFQDVLPYYGSSQVFKIEENGNSIINHTMYVPNKIEVNTFQDQVLTQGNSTYTIDRNNFTINWNPDNNNTNGILVVFMDTRISSLEQPGSDYIALHLADNGSAVIPNSVFQNIEIGGLCDMKVYRGDVNIVTGTNGLEYKVSALSTHGFQLIVN